MNLEQLLPTFVAECRERLEEMEASLLSVEQDGANPETVNAIFRAAHTIKGSAGIFSLDGLVAFTHVLENVLDSVRGGRIAITRELVSLLLVCCDHLRVLVDAVEEGNLAEEPIRAGQPYLDQLRTYLEKGDSVPAGPAIAHREDGIAQSQTPTDLASADDWHISLRFEPDALTRGVSPLSLIKYLNLIGTITAVVTVHEALPAAEEMDPESCYLGFELALRSDVHKAVIEDVFSFADDVCHVRIMPPHSRVCDYVQMIQSLPEGADRLGEILVRCGTLTRRELDAALKEQAGVDPAPPIGHILVEQGVVQPAVVEAAIATQTRSRESKSQDLRSIRVDAGKLDHMIDLVGELLIAAASTNLFARAAHSDQLLECTSKLTDLVEKLRDSALQLRMVKVGATFSRFQRIVHDVAHELGKDIELQVSGEETELDKTVIERITDPLTHLVRNAMDHGIEPADVRARAGKPARGTVRLNAFHDSGSIVIEVSDDGGGLKRDRILAKAIDRGLVEAGRVLSDSEIFDLIFEPGFSTAESITNLSGRGVGMDVVKRNITSLRGQVEIRSTEGTGTTVAIRLPLTLAIIEGFLVGAGDTAFVVPLDMIEECMALPAASNLGYIDLRGRALPLVRLREFFDMPGPSPARQNVIVIRHAGQRAGLVVDVLHGELQTVIKPLNAWFNHLQCISGSTVLGSGEVALILDIPALLQQAGQSSLSPFGEPAYAGLAC